MSILSSNKISIRQTPVTKDLLLKYGFKPDLIGSWFTGLVWTDEYHNTLRMYFKNASDMDYDIDFIDLEHLSIPHGFLDLYEGNRLKNLGQLLDLAWASKVMKGSKEREKLQNWRIKCLRDSLKDELDYHTITF